MSSAGAKSVTTVRARAQRLLARLSPRQRQYATLLAILATGVGVLWLVFASNSDGTSKGTRRTPVAPSDVTNIGVMAPGQQVSPVDQWVGTAGSKLAQYESEREEQTRLNRDRQTFEAGTMKRFAELEQRLTSAANANTAAPAIAPPLPPPPLPLPPRPAPTADASAFPPHTSLPVAAYAAPNEVLGMPVQRPATSTLPVAAALTRLPVTRLMRTSNSTAQEGTAPFGSETVPSSEGFLPVSFTRGTLIGGLDAPTGGQAQSNPHPVLIRLSDNSVLPNRFRGTYRDCFVIAAGYGDISSERAYLRTESLSCVHDDGSALEVRIQGSVYGEDGKVGMRGRLVTKQGQMLANALLAGVVGGIGQGVAAASTSYSTSPLGTIGTAQGADAMRSGVGTGVGRALDRLAQYYIKLAENTFPVIEIDAAREIDVVITKGVRIQGSPSATGPDQRRLVHGRLDTETTDDDEY